MPKLGIRLSKDQIQKLSESKPLEVERLLWRVKKSIDFIVQNKENAKNDSKKAATEQIKKHLDDHFCSKCGPLVEKSKYDALSSENQKLKHIVERLEQKLCDLKLRPENKQSVLSLNYLENL